MYVIVVNVRKGCPCCGAKFRSHQVLGPYESFEAAEQYLLEVAKAEKVEVLNYFDYDWSGWENEWVYVEDAPEQAEEFGVSEVVYHSFIREMIK